MPEQKLGKYLTAEIHYKVVSRPHILPKACSKDESDVLSQNLFDRVPAYTLTIKLKAVNLVCE